MPIRDFVQTPPAVVVLAASVLLALLLLRETSVMEDLPFYFSPEANYLFVSISGSDLSSGVYQLNDGSSILDVINLTGLASDAFTIPAKKSLAHAIDGAHYVVNKKGQKFEIVQRGWLPAGQRIALGIPLHPDRMSGSDWFALPGIGGKLAERIRIDRQKNGDFGALDAVQRVKGIGPAKIASWRGFFQD
jgi:competence protein ComEA